MKKCVSSLNQPHVPPLTVEYFHIVGVRDSHCLSCTARIVFGPRLFILYMVDLVEVVKKYEQTFY